MRCFALFLSLIATAVADVSPLEALIGDLYESKATQTLVRRVFPVSTGIAMRVTTATLPDDPEHPDYTRKHFVTPDGYRAIELHYQGRPLDIYQQPGGDIITAMSIEWAGKEIAFPAATFDDIGRVPMEQLTLLREPATPDERYLLDAFRARLDGPDISLSACGEILLITWVRREDGDTASTFRWMVSRAGLVLRHCESPEIYD